MKQIEVSRRFKLTREVSAEELKSALIESLRRSFDVEKTEDNGEKIMVEATTGGRDSINRHARVKLDIRVIKQQEYARFIVTGTSGMARSLMIGYVGVFILVLLAGLLPGSIETNIDSNASDTLVLMLFGIFIFYDINNKVGEPIQYLDSILQSLETEFG